MSQKPIVKVPIVHQGLRQEETILQVALALQYLKDVSKHIHVSYHKCLEEQRTRIKALNEKNHRLQAIIEKMKEKKESVILKSHPEFPKGELSEPCKIFSVDLPPLQLTKIEVNSPLPNYNPKDLEDKHHHFHLGIRRNPDMAPEGGLGTLPDSIDSLSSLLLLNTGENIYKKYKIIDPMKVTTRPRLKAGLSAEAGSSAVAPGSVYDDNPQLRVQDYSYSPVMHEDAPRLELPSDLLDAAGLPTEEDVEDLHPKNVPLPPSPSASETERNRGNEPKSVSICALLPSPDAEEQAAEPPLALSSPPRSAHQPPPPPPPPAAAVPLPAPHTTPSVQPQTDARSSLMEAIRKVGGRDNAKLRSVSDRPREVKGKEENKGPQISSGGLMADLHAKLSLRRKGISGNQPVDPMAKVLAMIPAPTPASASTARTGSDSDDAEWED